MGFSRYYSNSPFRCAQSEAANAARWAERSSYRNAPVDMIKTRLMLKPESERVGSYRNGFHCAYQVLRTEGPRGLYKGSLAMFARLGSQTTITFVVCEQLRELVGLKGI